MTVKVIHFCNSHLIPLETYSWSFLTCYHEPLIPFKFYTDPFQIELWVAFLIAGLTLLISLHCVIRFIFGKAKFTSMSLLLFLLATVSDDSCDLPEAVQKNVPIRIMLSPWYLSTVVIVNAYMGLVISNLLSPFPLKSISTFTELAEIKYTESDIRKNFLWQQVYNKEEFNQVKLKNLPPNFRVINENESVLNREQNFEIYSSPSSMVEFYDGTSSHLKHMFLQSFGRALTLFASKQIGNFYEFSGIDFFESTTKIKIADEPEGYRKLQEVLFNLFFPPHLKNPKGANTVFSVNETVKSRKNKKHFKWNNKLKFWFLVEQEIIQCGRSAYVDKSDDVLAEYYYLRNYYHRTPFFLSTESTLSQWRYWFFFALNDTYKAVKQAHRLIQSGLIAKTKKYFESAKHNQRVNYTVKGTGLKGAMDANGPLAITLSDRIQTCFYFYLLSILLTLCRFLIEIRPFLYTLSIKWLRIIMVIVVQEGKKVGKILDLKRKDPIMKRLNEKKSHHVKNGSTIN